MQHSAQTYQQTARQTRLGLLAGLASFVLLCGLFLFTLPSFAYGADSYRVDDATSTSITEHGQCYTVTNNSGQDVFVPTKTAGEWEAFYECADDGQDFDDGAPTACVPPGITGLEISTCGCIVDGVTVAEGDSYTFHLSTRPCGDACTDIDQSRTCTGGVLDGDSSYNTDACPAAAPCGDCTLDGATVTHLSSRVFYNTETVPCGSSCTGQTRNCFDTVLDGNASYQYATCTIDMCPFSVVMDPTLGNDGTTLTQVTIPAGTGSFNYELRWRQGAGPTTTVENLTGNYIINLPNSDPVTVEIRGTFPHWGGDTINYGVTDVLRWGEVQWQSMSEMFRNETQLSSYSAVDTPDLSSVTDMSAMFANANNFNGDISGWDVSAVTNMQNLFLGAASFNQPLGTWNVGSVTDMEGMFALASSFNQNIDAWNTANVTVMRSMFNQASSYNKPLNSWNVGNVTDMAAMFSGTTVFNQNISGWNISSVTDMNSMFRGTKAFNQPIDGWNVSNVTKMHWMFTDAEAFNQPLNSWDTSSVTNMNQMFRRWLTAAPLPFNQPLDNWDVSNVTGMSGMFQGNTNFDQNIRSWCVINIPSEPTNFDDGTSASWTAAEKPNWGNCGPPPFVVIMDPTVGNDGTTLTQVTVPTGTGVFDYTIRWEQGGSSGEVFNRTGDYVLGLPNSNPVRIEISGTFPHWGGDTTRYGVTDIVSWGEIEWQSMHQMLRSESSLSSYSATDAPDLKLVTDMSGMFQGASNFNGDISSWDVSGVTNMQNLFSGASLFNQNLGSWNVSAITNMASMFSSASNFNQDISTWNTANVTNMGGMFWLATSFNQPLDSWNVSNVTNMTVMFGGANSFNQPLGSWDVSSVTNMGAMFVDNTAFNQPLNNWDVSNVGVFANFLGGTFAGSVYNQPLDNWDVSSATNMEGMFGTSTFFGLTSSFNQDISTWDISSVTNMVSMFEGNSVFDQDISGWCVSGIGSKPTDFDTGTSASWTDPEKPCWGECGCPIGPICTVPFTTSGKDCTGTELASSSAPGDTGSEADCAAFCEGVTGVSCCQLATAGICAATDGAPDAGFFTSFSGASTSCGAAGADCTLDGVTVAHGSQAFFYSDSNPSCGTDCADIRSKRKCNDGTFEGDPSFDQASCTNPTGCTTDCTLDGVTVADGDSRVFYLVSRPCGDSCASISQNRTCTSGTLSGSASYSEASCPSAGCSSCSTQSVNWSSGSFSCTASATSHVHGATRDVTDSTGSDIGDATFLCDDGTWVEQSGICGSATFASCTLDGVTVPHGDSDVFYLSTRSCGEACTAIDQNRTCNDGTLDGSASYSEASCPPESCASCTTQTVGWTTSTFSCSRSASAGSHGVTRSLTDSTAPGVGSAVFECNDGSWGQNSGSCSGASCTLDGVTVNHGDSDTFYSTSSPSCGTSCAAVSQTRSCDDGTLDGSASFDNATCSEITCSAGVDVTWPSASAFCVGTVPGPGPYSHGGSVFVGDTTGDPTGTATFECNCGTWDLVGGSCGDGTVID